MKTIRVTTCEFSMSAFMIGMVQRENDRWSRRFFGKAVHASRRAPAAGCQSTAASRGFNGSHTAAVPGSEHLCRPIQRLVNSSRLPCVVLTKEN